MATATMTRPRLRVIGGVCAGFAEHTGLPVGAVRVAALVLATCGGAGILFYGWLWATVPERSDTDDSLRSTLTRPGAARSDAAHGEPGQDTGARTTPVTEILLGIALLAAGGAMVASRFGVHVPLAVIVPAVLVLAGAGLAWRQLDDLRRGRRPGSSGGVVRVLGALVLVVLGILLFFVTGDNPNVWTVFAAALAVLLGVAVVVAPWVVRLTRDLAEERAARLRSAERAEIATHLHDSVLQTLALIQQKSDPGSDAARLARAQERELRQWLFVQAPDAARDLAAELRRSAGEIEAEYAARVEVVTVGASVADAPDGLLAAAREAMLNAARHAGGSVTVYAEATASMVEVTVTDRGPGFDPDRVPEERFGVRESIVGRMRRAGGAAEIRRGPGGTGTEVRLSAPRAAVETTEESHE